jgi:type I restriction enzyme S subunit
MIQVVLSEAAEIIMGQSPPSSAYNTTGEGLPFFQGKADFGDLYPTARVFCTEPNKIAEAGDILISVRAPVGPTNLNPHRSCIGRGLAAIRANEKRANTKYLLYFLRFHEAALTLQGTGSTFDAISREDLNEIRLPLPPLPEQRHLAALLDKADRLRRLRRYALELSDTYLQSVFLEMFGDPVRNPKDWSIVKLETIGDLDRGRSKHRPRNEPALYGGPYPFIQTGDISNSSGYIKSHKQTYSEAGLTQSKMWPSGTLCITIAANIAKTAVLTFDACFPDSVVGFVPNDQTNVEYVQTWFAFNQESLEDVAPESAQKNINLEILRELNIALPPLNLQKQYAHITQKYERLRAQQREALRQAEMLFGALLQRAFSGEL